MCNEQSDCNGVSDSSRQDRQDRQSDSPTAVRQFRQCTVTSSVQRGSDSPTVVRQYRQSDSSTVPTVADSSRQFDSPIRQQSTGRQSGLS